MVGDVQLVHQDGPQNNCGRVQGSLEDGEIGIVTADIALIVLAVAVVVHRVADLHLAWIDVCVGVIAVRAAGDVVDRRGAGGLGGRRRAVIVRIAVIVPRRLVRRVRLVCLVVAVVIHAVAVLGRVGVDIGAGVVAVRASIGRAV